MKIFSLFFYLGILSTLSILFLYFHLGGIDEIYNFYLNFFYSNLAVSNNFDEFELKFYFYMYLFLSVFFIIWGGFISGKIKIVYLQLVLGIIFITIGYFVETVRFGFYFAGFINIILFVYFVSKISFFGNQIGFIKKYKQKKKEEFKLNAIKRTGEFIEVINDYGVKINNMPGKRAVYKVVHPLTDKEILVESELYFDKYFSINSVKNINIYFDRNNENKYILDIK